MGIDNKYGRVTVERVRNRPIGDDEPVVLFRSQDRLLPLVLDAYRAISEENGSPAEHLYGVDAARAKVVEWQREHLTQTPGSDELGTNGG